MSLLISSNRITVNDESKNRHRQTRLSCAIIGLLLCVPAQAFLPTPLSVVTTGELALNKTTAPLADAAKLTVGDSDQESQNRQAKQLLATWRQQVQADNLAEHTTWRRLLYVLDDKSVLDDKKVLPNKSASPSLFDSSLVDDAEFFLSANGQQDASAELDAMLVALATQIVTSQATASQRPTSQTTAFQTIKLDRHPAVCRFPARTQWLIKTLGIDESSVQSECPELDAWMTELDPEQLSIMFAEEYLDNPISAFAHTLLRIDSSKSAADPSQIQHAYAFNDTVDGDADDAFAVYTLKSISGQYSNLIEIDPYPKKLADYLKVDERDAWTHRLDLTPEEVQQIVLHIWETKDLDIPYYFTTDNCASEILRLIDVVRPRQHLLSRLPYAVIPSDVIELLNDEKLLVEARFTPSDSTVRQAELNKARGAAYLKNQTLTRDEVLTITSAEDNLASSMSMDKKTIIDHGIVASDNNPVDRHPLQMGQAGIGQRGDNSYIDVGVRAGFHDTLDRSSGFSQFFHLETLAATLRFYNDDRNNKPDRLVVENVTVLRARSFNPVNTAKQGKTWGINIEATRARDGSQENGGDHLVGSVGYETGWSWAFGAPRAGTGEMPPQLCYTLLSGTGQAGRGINNGFRIGAGVNVGCNYQINNQLRVKAQLQLPYWYHGDTSASDIKSRYWQPITTLGLQYDIDRKQALRLDASYDWQDRVDANDDIKLSYRRYF